MELFSEIYSCYYTVVNRILNEASKKALNKKEINEIIEKNAFKESALYILPKLISGEWDLINEREGEYNSKLASNVKLPVTALEKAWLKALLEDKRIALFLSEDQSSYLQDYLKEVNPLFNQYDFYYYDTFLDGDDYKSEDYVNNFRMIVEALKEKKLVTISMESGKGNRVTGDYLPCRLEYSSKDDKFRVYAARIKNDKVTAYIIMNMGRISQVKPCTVVFHGNINFNRFIENNKCKEPVVIEISKERNAVERSMLHFASYEKRTEYDEALDKYICYIYYDKRDETELLIRILSFGPVIKVIGPIGFLQQVKERVKRQTELMQIPWQQS